MQTLPANQPNDASAGSPKPVGIEEGKWRDPFIEELHEVRARLLARANGDMHQLVLNARQTAAQHGFAA